MHVCMGMFVHMSTGVKRDQKAALDHLELELHVVFSFLMRMLGTELMSSAGKICTMNL